MLDHGTYGSRRDRHPQTLKTVVGPEAHEAVAARPEGRGSAVSERRFAANGEERRAHVRDSQSDRSC